jgi:single-strand DNA-binding protein
MNTFNNSVQLIGHLGKDVELRTLENGNKMSKVSIATNEHYKNANGDRQEKTLWHQLVAWGYVAERMHLILKKGSFVAVKGKITYNSFEGKDGQRKYITQIQVNEFHLLDKVEKPEEAQTVV